MHPTKMASVLDMDGQSRHAYFVRKIADMRCVWGLEQSGWAMAEDDLGVKTVPFWPEEDFARLCASGKWSGYSARRIDLNAFLDRWLPGMHRDGIKVAVFPKPDDRGVIVEAEQLRSAIEAESAQYE